MQCLNFNDFTRAIKSFSPGRKQTEEDGKSLKYDVWWRIDNRKSSKKVSREH